MNTTLDDLTASLAAELGIDPADFALEVAGRITEIASGITKARSDATELRGVLDAARARDAAVAASEAAYAVWLARITAAISHGIKHSDVAVVSGVTHQRISQLTRDAA